MKKPTKKARLAAADQAKQEAASALAESRYASESATNKEEIAEFAAGVAMEAREKAEAATIAADNAELEAEQASSEAREALQNAINKEHLADVTERAAMLAREEAEIAKAESPEQAKGMKTHNDTIHAVAEALSAENAIEFLVVGEMVMDYATAKSNAALAYGHAKKAALKQALGSQNAVVAIDVACKKFTEGHEKGPLQIAKEIRNRLITDIAIHLALHFPDEFRTTNYLKVAHAISAE